MLINEPTIKECDYVDIFIDWRESRKKQLSPLSNSLPYNNRWKYSLESLYR